MGQSRRLRDLLGSRRLTIGGRMRLAACIGFFGILLIEVLSVVTLRELARVPGQLDRHAISVGQALNDIQLELAHIQTELTVIATSPTTLRARNFERRTGAANAKVRKLLVLVEERLLAGHDQLRAARLNFADWELARRDLLAAIAKGDRVAAYTLAKTDGLGAVATAFTSFERVETRVIEESDKLRSEAVHALEIAILRLEIMLTLAAIGVFLVIYYIMRKVVGPTSEISAAIGTVAEGKTDVEIPHTSRLDEIGDIARSAEVFLQRAIAIRNARHDVLTGLPTREHMLGRIKDLRVNPEEADREAALLHVDIDRLGELNDSLGRSVGDATILRVAEVLRGQLGEDDMLARESGDSFILLLLDCGGLEAVETAAQALSDAVAEPMQIGERRVRVSCSVGLTIYSNDTSVDDLLLQAENAVQEGRKRGFGQVQVYTREMDARLRMRRKTLLGLKEALENGEIEPFFQPQVDARTGQLEGFEALVRWHHPELGLLSPWQFMDVAAEAGLLSAVTDTMIAKSTSQLAEWRRQGLDVPRVSLNCAASDLARANFADRLMLLVERAGLEPRDVCVELLETAMIEDDQNPVSRTLDRLEGLGFPIELDDFGTGHAAISTLHIVKLSGLKVDRSFVTDLHMRPDQQHLTKGILRISNALQISTVAEGVESPEERAILIEFGCHILQGFLIAPPMPASEATTWLRTYDPISTIEALDAAPFDAPIRDGTHD